MIYNLGKIAIIKGGKRIPKGEKLQEEKNDHPYLRIADFDGRNFSQKDLKYVPDNVFPDIRNYVINVGDIFLSIVGTIGIAKIINKSLDGANLTENAVKISPTDCVDRKYLELFLQSRTGQSEIASRIVGSTQPKLPIKNIKNIEIDLPTLSEQKKIAKKIDTLDRKIDLNNQINDNLLAQVRTYFDNLYKNADEAKTLKLSDLIQKTITGDWGKSNIEDGFNSKVSIIRGTDFDSIRNGGIGNAPVRFIKENSTKKKHLKANDILIEISGGSPTQSTGRSLIISKEIIKKFDNTLLGTNFTRCIRPKSENDSYLIESYLNFLYQRNVFFNYENGTTGIKNLDYKAVFNISLPDVRLSNKFNEYIFMAKKYYKAIQNNGNENLQLTKLKEIQLNKYF